MSGCPYTVLPGTRKKRVLAAHGLGEFRESVEQRPRLCGQQAHFLCRSSPCLCHCVRLSPLTSLCHAKTDPLQVDDESRGSIAARAACLVRLQLKTHVYPRSMHGSASVNEALPRQAGRSGQLGERKACACVSTRRGCHPIAPSLFHLPKQPTSSPRAADRWPVSFLLVVPPVIALVAGVPSVS